MTKKTQPKKYKTIYVSMLKPNSIESKKILSKTLPEPKTSRQIVSMINKELKVSFRSNGRIGAYLSYKALSRKKPYYYILTISK